MAEPLLDVRDLRVTFHSDTGSVRAVDGVSFALGEDEVLGIVGESGSGKSVSMMSVMRLLDEHAAELEGEVRYGGRDLIGLSQRDDAGGARLADRDGLPGPDELAQPGLHGRLAARGADPRARRRSTRAGARERAVELLRSVGIPEPERRVDDYPHQFSGGMRQRVMIAMALSCDPQVLIADEPTTALDVTIQAQILELIGALRERTRMSVVLITHDMGVVAGIADRVARDVRGAGDRGGPDARGVPRPAAPVHVEPARLDPAAGPPAAAAADRDPGRAARPSTDAATGCAFAPRCPHRFERCDELPPLGAAQRAPGHLDACHLPVDGPARPLRDRTRHERGPAPRDRRAQALPRPLGRPAAARGRRACGRSTASTSRSSAGETLGLVGESGCGKSTLARAPAAADRPRPRARSSSTGATSPRSAAAALRPIRARHPDGLPGPVRVAEPAQADRREHRAADADPQGAPARARSRRRCASCSGSSGSRREHASRYPHEFSRRPAPADRDRPGARAAAASWSSPTSRSPRWTSRSRPRSSTCSRTCRRSSGTTYVFVAHDLSVVRQVSDRIAVMYLGKVVEVGPAEERLRGARPPVHRGAALRRAGPGSRRRAARADRAPGRRAEPGRAARRAAASTRAAATRPRCAGRPSRRWSPHRDGPRRRVPPPADALRGVEARSSSAPGVFGAADGRRARGARLGRDGRRAVRARRTRAAARATGRGCCGSATASSARRRTCTTSARRRAGSRCGGRSTRSPAGRCSSRPGWCGSPRTTAARRSWSRGGWTPAGAPFERLTPDATAALFPDMAVDDLAFSLYEPDACVIRAGDGGRGAAARGRPTAARGWCSTARGPPGAGAVALAGGDGARPTPSSGPAAPWLGALLPALAPVRPSWQDVLHWSAPPGWRDGPAWFDERVGLYGFPDVDGLGHQGGQPHAGADARPRARRARARARDGRRGGGVPRAPVPARSPAPGCCGRGSCRTR